MKETKKHEDFEKNVQREIFRPSFSEKEKTDKNLEVLREKADVTVEERLNLDRGMSGLTEIGNPEKAKNYLDLANKYMNEYRRYERDANRLSNQIARKQQPESRQSEVSRLHDKAKRAKIQADRYNRLAKMELNRN